jgi:catechol 2,3-dioxygenase-like lactoylglutathione lyase family enzyme
MPLHRLTSITIGVPNVDETRAFYRDFGLTETAPGRFATQAGGEQLRIVAAPRRNLLELGLGVDDPDDLARIASALARLHAHVVREGTTLAVSEPTTGIRVVLGVAERIVEASEPALATNGPGRSPRVDARSAVVAQKGAVRPRKLGHVVVGSSDAPGARRFFVDGLGFKVSDEIPGIGAAFMRCSTDHHNVLVQPAPLTLLHHTSWEVGDVDEIGRAASRMIAEHPERHVWGLGRHAIGSNFFWYLRDPAGNFAEYYSDLDVIVDDELWKVRASTGADGLAAWGPPVPPSFLAPEDIMDLLKAEAR